MPAHENSNPMAHSRHYALFTLLLCLPLASANAQQPGTVAKAGPGLATTHGKKLFGFERGSHAPMEPVHRIFPPPRGARSPIAEGMRGGGPANDEACDAPVDALTIGGSLDWSGSLAGATDSEGFGAPTVWQAFTLGECADVTLDWCGTTPPHEYDWTVLLDGDCDALANYYYPGDPSPCGDGNLVIPFHTLPPGTYYVPVADADGIGGGYSIHVTATACPSAPPNDEICDVVPQPLALGDSLFLSGTMAGATDQEGFGMNTVWEAFTLDACADVNFNWCGSSSDALFGSFMLVTGDCGEPEDWNMFYASIELTDCGDGNLLGTAYGLPAGTYHIMIFAGPVDTYNATVTAVPCVPPPANDHCEEVAAVPLALDSTVTFSGHVISATPDGDYGPGFAGDQSVNTVWHAFTTTACANITVTFCGMEPPYDTYWTFLGTSCPVDSLYLLGSYDWQQCANGAVTIQFWEVPAGTYHLPVGDLDGYAWPYTVQVHAAACGPYCAAWANSATPVYEKISQVSFAGIERSSTMGIGYEDFLEDTAQVARGGSYAISVTLSNAYEGDQVLAWIDLDQDMVFQPEELVFASGLGAGPFSGTVTVPMDVALGTTRMRVRMHDAGHPDWANDAPCGMASYGQVEDYSVQIGVGQGIQGPARDRFVMKPNPVTDQLTVTFAPGERPLQLIMHDATGRTVRTEAMSGNAGPFAVDMGNMACGLYLIQVLFADGTQAVQRIVKK